jgi:hypothetical protein
LARLCTAARSGTPIQNSPIPVAVQPSAGPFSYNNASSNQIDKGDFREKGIGYTTRFMHVISRLM